ncbi:MAG: signal recognition particle receptor subunit alpha, partial [candidate division KSB1 bacterium]
MASFFEKLKSGLSKTRRSIVDNIVQVVTGKARLDAAIVEELENTLLAADVGPEVTTALIEHLRERITLGKASSREEVVIAMKSFLQERLLATLNGKSRADFFEPTPPPFVMMIVGVNGVGKTTTIAKIAN